MARHGRGMGTKASVDFGGSGTSADLRAILGSVTSADLRAIHEIRRKARFNKHTPALYQSQQTAGGCCPPPPKEKKRRPEGEEATELWFASCCRREQLECKSFHVEQTVLRLRPIPAL